MFHTYKDKIWFIVTLSKIIINCILLELLQVDTKDVVTDIQDIQDDDIGLVVETYYITLNVAEPLHFSLLYNILTIKNET